MAVDMRKSQGFVTKKYSAKLKDGSPCPKSTRFDGGEGSVRVEGSVSRRLNLLSVASGARGGGSAQLAYSASSNRWPFRNHVDSMVFRGKQAARALFSDDSSYEILSRNPGRVVSPIGGSGSPAGVGPRIVESPAGLGPIIGENSVGLPASRGEEGSRFQEEVNELYGGLGFSDNMVPANSGRGVQKSVMVSKGKGKIPAEIHGDSSTESSTTFGYGGLLGRQQIFRGGIMLGQQRSGSVSSQPISGLGGPSRGLERVDINGPAVGLGRVEESGQHVGNMRPGPRPDLMGLVNGLVVGSSINPNAAGLSDSALLFESMIEAMPQKEQGKVIRVDLIMVMCLHLSGGQSMILELIR
ncbi:hypothetical protein COLO4_27224 [Corchorus olitorius]|uniref:Uncharacterized protein n=1 Tax=Corchorus olitorius TaxID=93759 RepID=A0A1R3HS05_9ROSI|nr:hypothetical protein COLO4_27224 [Corchorus olitorius]